jgi:Transglutaminase-like superfamily
MTMDASRIPRWRFFAASLILLFVVSTAPPTFGADDILGQIPEVYRSGVSRALSGGNGRALRASFAKLEGEEREGWAFLLASMGRHNVPKLTEPILTEHVKYAYRAWRELPWAKAVEKEVFLHYVLPILSGDEKLEAWRKHFFDEVAPRLKKKGCRTPEKAALEVNKYCGSKVSFKGTPPEDSSPLETLRRGYGRCEEEGIFFNAVARSVGVPARIASTPYWTFKASNHAWCEVYTGGSGAKARRPWRYLGACEPAGKLDQAWFSGSVKRAALVLSRCIGHPESDDVLTHLGSSAVINTTKYYTKTCRMNLIVTDAEGNPAAGAAVAMYIFNEVGNEPIQRSVFQARADEKGEFAFDLGPGDYLVHAKGPDAVGFAIARSAPGKNAACRIVLGHPSPGIGVSGSKASGTTGLRLKPGPGGKDATAGICRLDAMPFKPARLVPVDKSGATVELPPGRYLVQTGRRKGDAAIHVTLQVVDVKAGEVVAVAVPGKFPKRPGRGENKTGAFLLTYPRK